MDTVSRLSCQHPLNRQCLAPRTKARDAQAGAATDESKERQRRAKVMGTKIINKW